MKKTIFYGFLVILTSCASPPREADYEPMPGVTTAAQCEHRCKVKGLDNWVLDSEDRCTCPGEKDLPDDTHIACNRRCIIKGWSDGGQIGSSGYCVCNDGSKGLSQ
jgi:hypothetical protein